MRLTENITLVEKKIKGLALNAINNLSVSDHAYRIARYSAKHPIDYMRYAEFDAILKDLVITPGMEILDISSPQWFSIYLAGKYPETVFHYINITDKEVDPYKRIVESIGIKNLRYKKEDVRALKYASGMFAKAISISVIEHIYPKVNGDLMALAEIRRVLKPDGELLLTVPYKEKHNIVYMDGPVYERNAKKGNFFAREYDEEMFHQLVGSGGFALRDCWFICERMGMFSKDYYEWGPGKDVKSLSKCLLKVIRQVEHLPSISFDSMLAKRYLSISREINGRVVNISAALVKT
jgi:SAM-dependent methyltransferase